MVEIFPCDVIPATPAEMPPVVVKADALMLPPTDNPFADICPVVDIFPCDVIPPAVTYNPFVVIVIPEAVTAPLGLKLPVIARLPPTDTFPLVVNDAACILPPTDKPLADNCPVVEIFPCEVIPAAPAEIPPVVVKADAVMLPLLLIPAADN